MNNETITTIEDVLLDGVNYVRITTTAAAFVVTLDMGLHVSRWLSNGHEWRSQASILKTARARQMSDRVLARCSTL